MDSINFADGSYFDHGLSAEVENKWVFEVAWEVVNKGWFFFLITFTKM